jgi:hypothetical protein
MGTERISADRLLRLSKVFDVRPVYFFGLEDSQKPLEVGGLSLTLTYEGWRLNRAFAAVKNDARREAI